MTREVRVISPDCIFTEVAEIFDRCGYHHLPVVRDGGEFVGMVSKSDYNKLQHHFTILRTGSYEAENQRLFKSLIASDIMHPDLYTIKEDDMLKDAINLLLENRFHSLVVVSEGKCVGIVTPHDILKTAINQNL